MVESRRHGDVLSLDIVARFGLGGRNVADRLEQVPVIEPVDPFQGGEFDGFQGAPRAAAPDHLGLVEAVASENAIKGRPYADGVITSHGTFQKYYMQAELRSFIEGTLEASAIALAPGVLLVFKDPSAEQRFQLGRTRSRLRIRPPLEPRPAKPIREPKPPWEPKSTKEPKQPKPGKSDPWELCPNAFVALHRRWEELAREPGPEEIEARAKLEEVFGSLPRALRVACNRLDGERLRTARNQRREDVLVYLVLQALGRRKP